MTSSSAGAPPPPPPNFWNFLGMKQGGINIDPTKPLTGIGVVENSQIGLI